MRTIRLASFVFFLGALACVAQNHAATALFFAALGFGLTHVAESNIDWQQRITRNWRREIGEPRWQTTLVGGLAQWLAFICLAGSFLVASH